MFKDELEYNMNVDKKNGIKDTYVDFDYAVERLEDEGKSNILANIPMDGKISDGESFINARNLYDSLVHEETTKYQIMGDR